jgi:hypothetical protein
MNKKFLIVLAVLFASFVTAFAQTKMVTFQVQSPDSTPVYVFGSWNWSGWPGTPMTSLGGGKYTATLPLAQNMTHEYLFVNGATPVKEVLNSTWSCTNGSPQFTNRVLALGAADTGVCYTFATCNTCTVTPPPPPPTNVNVTFQVQSPDSTPVYVFGSWNWGGFPGTPMTSLGGGKYTATLPLLSGMNHEYLFVNGATPVKEVLTPTWPCTNGNTQFTNRVLALGTKDTGVCYTFATCNTCTVTPPPPPPTNVNVTFQVQSPDSTPVYVFGSWNWGGFPGTPMISLGGGKYKATVSLLGGMTHEYLFVNGATPKKETMNPTSSCTNGNLQFTNRVLALGNADTSICYTWQTCTTCTITPPPTNVNVTFRVENPDSTPVYVFGSWNWSGFPGTPLTSIGNNIYEGTVSLLNNANYEYLFVNGNTPVKEVMSATAPCTNGATPFTNRVMNLGVNDTTLCYKWGTCNSCTPPAPTGVNITFQVETPSAATVYVFGNWNNWGNFPGTPLTLISGTTYGATINMPINATYEYLYVKDTTKEVLNPTWSCTNGNGQYTNRKITVAASDLTKCNKWASCDTCGQVTPVNINVKFAVQKPDSTPVYVFGNWNNWGNFPGTPMMLNSATGNYEASIAMLANKPIEYLYVNGTGTKEVLNPAGACTNGNQQNTNRLATLGSNDTTFCNRWATCTKCFPVSIGDTPNDVLNLIVSNHSININSNTLSQIDQLEIFDLVGKKVFTSNGKIKTNENINVDLQNDVLYIIRVKNGATYHQIKAILK